MRSRAHAVNGYLVKPVSTTKLRDTINRILGPVIP
jgi:two-component SAPR family response regulator